MVMDIAVAEDTAAVVRHIADVAEDIAAVEEEIAVEGKEASAGMVQAVATVVLRGLAFQDCSCL